MPTIARATDPPICRKNVRFEVATPSSWKGTAFWTMIVNTAKVGPTPRPARNIQNQTTGNGVSAVSWVMRAVAMPMSAIAPTVSHLYLPVRDTMIPDTIELKMSPAMSGRAASPEFVGEKPWTNWNQRGRKMIAPKNAKLAKKVATIELEYVRFRNRCSGMIGSLARDSAPRNRRIPTSPARRNPPTVGSAHWPNCLFVRPRSRKVIATAKIAPPRMSKFLVALAVFTVGSNRWMTISDTMPIGMLT